MYVQDVISRLNKHIIRMGNCDYYPVRNVHDEIETLGKVAVRWYEKDFEYIAKEKKGTEWEEWYDKERFDEALISMINKHDAETGITWETIEAYLEEYCRKKDPPIA